jgi:solute carrier family 15 oligopeptide transporter 1
MSRVAVEKVESGKVSESCESSLKYPKSVPFILVNVFFERFCSGGILGELSEGKFSNFSPIFHLENLAILAIFLNTKLNFNSDVSTAIFHANEFILYFFTIVGAIVADSWLGLFKTILLLTSLFSIGAGMIAVASIDLLQLPIK